MSDFDRDALQGEVYEHTTSMNTAFLSIIDLFKNSFEEAETKEDVVFIGNGAESIYQLLFEYRAKLDEVLASMRKQYKEMEAAEKTDSEFEKAILASLDKLPLTDMYDVR